MNTSVMERDVHSPSFIRAKSTHDKTQAVKPTRSIDWRRIIELTLLLSLVVAAVYFIAKLVTPQVVTVIGIFVGFLVLRFVIKTILQITFTILGYLFWLAILAAILICIF